MRIQRINNLCDLKEHLSDFLKASMSQIDLIWFFGAFHRIIDLYEHTFLIISVLGLGNLKAIFLLKSYLLSYFTKRQLHTNTK